MSSIWCQWYEVSIQLEKIMNLKLDSRLVRFAYFFARRDHHPSAGYVKKTSLCAFFWRCFVFVPLFWILLASALGVSIYEVGKNFTDFLMGAAIITVVVGAGLGIAFLIEYVQKKINARRYKAEQDRWAGIVKEPTASSLFFDWVTAKKRKVCPIITFKE